MPIIELEINCTICLKTAWTKYLIDEICSECAEKQGLIRCVVCDDYLSGVYTNIYKNDAQCFDCTQL